MARKIEWMQVLRENGIPFVDRGPNVARGHINIQCPFCGSADPSKHMGLELETGFWGCWRNNTHRGKSPLRLFTKLLNIPYWKGKKLLGLDEEGYIDPDGFDAVADRIMGRDSRVERIEQVRREFLDFPSEFETIRPQGTTARFYEYLAYERSFGERGVDRLSSDYAVSCAKRGRQAGRVILPYVMNGLLTAWTGRAIGSASIRYLDLDRDECLIPPKESLFNHDCIIDGGRALLVVEGPVDALKIDVFGEPYGVRAVGLSTNSLSEEQAFLIEAAADQFTDLYFMMDNATSLGIVDSMRMRSQLNHIPNLRGSLPVPFDHKDAAQMTPKEARQWSQELAERIKSAPLQ